MKVETLVRVPARGRSSRFHSCVTKQAGPVALFRTEHRIAGRACSNLHLGIHILAQCKTRSFRGHTQGPWRFGPSLQDPFFLLPTLDVLQGLFKAGKADVKNVASSHDPVQEGPDPY